MPFSGNRKSDLKSNNCLPEVVAVIEEELKKV